MSLRNPFNAEGTEVYKIKYGQPDGRTGDMLAAQGLVQKLEGEFAFSDPAAKQALTSQP